MINIAVKNTAETASAQPEHREPVFHLRLFQGNTNA